MNLIIQQLINSTAHPEYRLLVTATPHACAQNTNKGDIRRRKKKKVNALSNNRKPPLQEAFLFEISPFGETFLMCNLSLFLLHRRCHSHLFRCSLILCFVSKNLL